MTSLEVLAKLRDAEQSLITNRDVSDLLRISKGSVAKHMATLHRQKFVEKVSRGKWIVKSLDFDPFQIAEFITAPNEAYISLYTAFFYHGMIDQIPARTYAVTVDRTKVVKTPVGIYSFHHCNPDFFMGYEYIKPYLKVATPEKALVDYFYFSPARSKQFSKLPEFELPPKFSWEKAFYFCERIPSRRTRSFVFTKIRALQKKY